MQPPAIFVFTVGPNREDGTASQSGHGTWELLCGRN